MRVGIVGASGYGGTELIRLCAAHKAFEVTVAAAHSQAGTPIATHTPSLGPLVGTTRYDPIDPALLRGLDVVFFALPHGESSRLMGEVIDEVPLVVDLAADFRLGDAATYEAWYHEAHHAPHLLDRFVCGVVEQRRDALVGATAIAVPGCYPTAATLALAPFVDAGILDGSRLIIDAASGTSGAGRGVSDRLHFSNLDGSFSAYGLCDHRHTAEMEQFLSTPVLFTPHLAPMARGMLATCYAAPLAGALTSSDEAMAILHDAYDSEPFVFAVEAPPSTKDTLGANTALVTARVDVRSKMLIAICAIDNLVKGAAGHAIQSANVALGLEETLGLSVSGLFP